MNMIKSIELMSKYANCPKCGCDKVGNGSGGLILNETMFRRYCRCGFDITVDENNKEIETVKVEFEMPLEDLRTLKEFLGCQHWEDSNNIIHKYNLDTEADYVEDILKQLYENLFKLDCN